MQSSRSARTRQRILDASLALFNEHGEAHVTTGHIADELNISPGNLYYHFRNKEEIVRHLFAAFEGTIDVRPGEFADTPAIMEDFWLYLHMMFECIWRYRFLYRNLDDLLARDMRLRSHFNAILSRQRGILAEICHALAERGAIRAEQREIESLAESMLVIATYWLNYENLKTRAGIGVDPARHMARGALQTMALLKPYLAGDARSHLDYLMRQYRE